MKLLSNIFAQVEASGKESVTERIDTLTTIIVLISAVGLFLIIRMLILQRRKKRGANQD